MSTKEERILRNNYYKVGAYWKGWEAINKLAAKSKIDEKIVEKWLRKQAVAGIPSATEEGTQTTLDD